jgi:hypothetical protein
MSEKVKPGLLRRRRAPVQVDLPLPEPHGATPDGDDDVDLVWWQRRPTVIALAALAALLLIGAILSQLAAHGDRLTAAELERRVRTQTLRPPSTERVLRVEPNTRSWSASPDATMSWPDPPELVELYLPVAYAPFTTFAITIDKVDQGRMMILQRVVPDSNHDLRVSLNSSAFGPGEYRIRLQGYTWRGERIDVGWVRLVVIDSSPRAPS